MEVLVHDSDIKLQAADEHEVAPTRFRNVHGTVVALLPQPSNDPNDPLNWPTMQKWLLHCTICFFSFLATVNTSKFNVAILAISKDFKQDTTHAGFLVSFSVLALGIGNFLWMIALRKLGRRPVFLSSMPLLAATNAWSAYATSYRPLLAATILSGIASGAAEAPVSTVVADIFFAHERGATMMVFHIALSAGFFLGPAINAALVQYVTWRWVCGWIAIASIATWAAAWLTVEETSYRRMDISLPPDGFSPRRTLLSRLTRIGAYNRELSLTEAISNNFKILTRPVVFWSGLTIGVFVGWNIIVQLTTTRTFTQKPYHFQLHNIGLMAISGFIGALIAMYLGGKMIDIIADRMAARHNGVRKPEYRLPALVIPAIVGPMGILTFGLCLAAKTTWVGPAFGFGMQGFGLTAASNILVTYAVDAYYEFAGEVVVSVFVLRGVIGCLISLYAPDWFAVAGLKATFGQMVGTQYFLLAFAPLFYFYGRRFQLGGILR